MKMSAVPQTPEWQRMKSLVGIWEGTVAMEGKQVPATVEVRMTGDGSAIMHVMDKGGPHEMVTMIHPDGKRLLATHYCAAHNQPRMALVPSSAAGQVAFSFVDGTNIGPGEEHMRSVVFTFARRRPPRGGVDELRKPDTGGLQVRAEEVGAAPVLPPTRTAAGARPGPSAAPSVSLTRRSRSR